MTDRIKGCWVAFERDYRTDDAEEILAAIRCLRGVADVRVSVTNVDDFLARAHVRRELGEKFLELYREILDIKS